MSAQYAADFVRCNNKPLSHSYQQIGQMHTYSPTN